MRAERISSRWGSENFFNLGEDLNHFFQIVLLLFSIKFPNLGEDRSSDSHQFRPHCLNNLNQLKICHQKPYEISEISDILGNLQQNLLLSRGGLNYPKPDYLTRAWLFFCYSSLTCTWLLAIWTWLEPDYDTWQIVVK